MTKEGMNTLKELCLFTASLHDKNKINVDFYKYFSPRFTKYFLPEPAVLAPVSHHVEVTFHQAVNNNQLL